MEMSTGLEGLSFEPLVDGVGGCPSFHDAVRHAFGPGLSDHIVWMNQIDRVKGGGSEGGSIQAPMGELVKEIIVHAPILKGLKVAVKPSPRVCSDIVNVNFFACFCQHDGGGQTGQPRTHDVNGFGS